MPGGRMPVGSPGAPRWMAKFDISAGNADAESCGLRGSVLKAEDSRQAIREPASASARLGNHSTRMHREGKHLRTSVRGGFPPAGFMVISVCFLASSTATADPVTETRTDEVP